MRKLSRSEQAHRVISETVWHYRGMWFRKRYGSVGMLGVPFTFAAEVLAPVFEALTVVTIVGALATGLFDAQLLLLVAFAIAFVNAALTACAMLLDDLFQRTHRKRDLVWMLVLAPLDLPLSARDPLGTRRGDGAPDPRRQGLAQVRAERAHVDADCRPRHADSSRTRALRRDWSER